jgi:hypothetical protein
MVPLLVCIAEAMKSVDAVGVGEAGRRSGKHSRLGKLEAKQHGEA